MASLAPSADRWIGIANQIVRLDRPIPLWHGLCFQLWRLALHRALRDAERP